MSGDIRYFCSTGGAVTTLLPPRTAKRFLEDGTLVSLEFSMRGDSVSLKLWAYLHSQSRNRCGFEFMAVTAIENDLIRRAWETLDVLE